MDDEPKSAKHQEEATLLLLIYLVAGLLAAMGLFYWVKIKAISPPAAARSVARTTTPPVTATGRLGTP
jgi:flagellar basal body-associated protein FliL